MNIEVSKDFKKKTQSAVIAIVVFILVYLLLFIFTTALAVGCVVGGVALIIAKPMILTFMLGAGLAGMGVMIFYFIIKFLFKKHINDRSGLTEIRRTDEPELFKMIDQIVKEAGTNPPKKVYLSYEVNASVFYDSSFWSMFLPIQKNLTIGMALINTTTTQELKAILSHEFGHFSQRSMKVGSYVYNVNQIIFNLVNDDESYRESVESFAKISGYFSFFASLAFFFIRQIQWVLVKMYNFVNLRHMALSREMEFHADEVAAHISGSLPLEESLLRLDLAENSYERVIDFYNGRFSEAETSKNMYKEQSFVMNFLATQTDVDFKNGLPDVKLEESGLFTKSKLNIENQWASHPSMEDRVVRLRTLNIQKENNTEAAKNLFKNFSETEEKMTQKLFSGVKYEKPKSSLEFEVFQSEFEKKFYQNSFYKKFNSYYDNKNPDFTVQKVDFEDNVTFDELFSKEKAEWVYNLIALESDLKTVESISKKEVQIKTFDYDGVKYKQKDAKNLVPKIQESLKETKEKILQNDSDIYNYFLKIAKEQNRESNFLTTYKTLGEFDALYEEKFKIYVDLANSVDFLSQKTPFEKIKQNFSKLQPLETKLKNELAVFVQNDLLTKELSESDIKDIQYFVDKDLIYFYNDEYRNHDLQLLMKAINFLPYFLHRKYFFMKKDLLGLMKELQESIVVLENHN